MTKTAGAVTAAKLARSKVAREVRALVSHGVLNEMGYGAFRTEIWMS